MLQNLRSRLNINIILLIGFFIIVGLVIYLIVPKYKELQSLHSARLTKELEWHTRQLQAEKSRAMTQEIMANALNKKLIDLHSHWSKSMLAEEIIRILGVHHVQLVEFLPKEMQPATHSHSFLVKIKGSEPDLIDTIKDLINQNWVIAFSNINFIFVNQELTLQMQMDFYYD